MSMTKDEFKAQFEELMSKSRSLDLEPKDIYDWCTNPSNEFEFKQLLYFMMAQDKLSIAELVKMQEKALHQRYDNLKEDASNLSAYTILYRCHGYDEKDKKGNPIGYTKQELDDRTYTILNKLGFVNFKRDSE